MSTATIIILSVSVLAFLYNMVNLYRAYQGKKDIETAWIMKRNKTYQQRKDLEMDAKVFNGFMVMSAINIILYLSVVFTIVIDYLT